MRANQAKFSRRRDVIQWGAAWLALAGGGLAVGHAAPPAKFPTRPITLVTPFGGGTEAGARIVAQFLAEKLGTSVVVEQKIGASGTIAMAHLARARADGHTLAMGTTTTLTTALFLYKSPGYDAGSSFAYLGLTSTTRQMLVVSPKLGVTTLAQLIALAKQRPGQLNFGSPGQASAAHLAAEQFAAAAGIEAVHVPYRTGADVETALMAGDVHFTFNSLSVSIGLVKAGRLVAVAMTGSGRDERLPQVPALEELGFKDLISDQFYGLLAPANVPADVLATLTSALKAVVEDPRYVEAQRRSGADASTLNEAQFRALADKDRQTWGGLIQRLKIEPQ